MKRTSLGDVFKSFDKRINSTNYATGIQLSPDVDPAILNPLEVLGLTASSVEYYIGPNNTALGRFTVSWTSPPSDPDDLTEDVPVDYVIGWTFNAASTVLPSSMRSTKRQITFTLDNIPLFTSVRVFVATVGASGRRSANSSITVYVGNGFTVLNQPSIPIVARALKGINVTWNGLDYLGNAYPETLKRIDVYVRNTAFTSVTGMAPAGQLFHPNQTIYVSTDYGTQYVRLVAVNVADVPSALSATASMGVTALVETDLGIVLPGDIAFRDQGNLVVDGSFESDRLSDLRAAEFPSYASWSPIASHGTRALRISPSATYTKTVYLHDRAEIDRVPIEAGTRLYISAKIQNSSANGTASVALYWVSETGTITFNNPFTVVGPSSNYTQYEAGFLVPSTARYLIVVCRTISHTTGYWYFDEIQVRQVIGTQLIQDAGITNAKIANLAVNNAKIEDMEAGKITTGRLRATTDIIAGDPNGYHSKLHGSGFSSMAVDAEGNPIEVVSLGTSTNSILGINRNGVSVASIDEYGSGNFNKVSAGEVFVDGANIELLMNVLPKGIIHVSRWTGSWTGTGWDNRFLRILTWLDAPRAYKITVGGGQVEVVNLNNNLMCSISVNTNGTLSTGQFQRNYFKPQVNNLPETFPNTTGVVTIGSSGLYNIIIGLNSSSQFTAIGESGYGWVVTIEDLGATYGMNQNYSFLGTGTTPSESTTYTSIWNLSDLVAYTGSGSAKSSKADVMQGYYSSLNGNQYTRLLFNNNAVSGENRTIASALSGATIQSVELYLKYHHWYNNAGGTSVIRANTSTTASGGTNSGAITSSNWRRGEGKWVNITSIFGTGYRSIQVGPGLSTSATYYGKAYGVGSGSNLPKIRIKYTR